MAWYTQGGKVVIGPGGNIFDSGTSVSISALWANDGGDKVTQDELRLSNLTNVTNTCWDGTNILQFGAMNEVVSFNIILEAANRTAQSVAVTMSNLVNGGNTIRCDQTRSTSGNGLFDWTTKPTEVELFYVRYLQINCLSPFAFGGAVTGGNFEPQVPSKLRLPLVGGVYTGSWLSRPNAGKYYPDIAVPLELVPTFTITSGHNQQIWVDVYIPKTAITGLYTGTVTITESGSVTHTIPVKLTVRNFTLPDVPSFQSIVFSSYGDISQRYTGSTFPPIGGAADLLARQVLANQRYIAHRHKQIMVGDDESFAADGSQATQPGSAYIPFVTGTAFTSGNGYAGPGVSTANGVYGVMFYGYKATATWPNTQTGWNTNTNNWETWFEANASTTTRFVYLADESHHYGVVQGWANWMATNPGVGVNLASFSTIGVVDNVGWSSATAYVNGDIVFVSGTLYTCILAHTNHIPPNATYWTVLSVGGTNYVPVTTLEPAVKIVCSASSGATAAWNTEIANLASRSVVTWRYNGARPYCPTIHTEEPGTDPRAIAWCCYKKGEPLWFGWESTYYNDTQANGNGTPQANLFVDSRTYAANNNPSGNKGSVFGDNADGLLFFPGTDAVYPAVSYGIAGPIASLRFKHLRRGTQDADYLALANAINPSAVTTIVAGIVPLALWETPVANTSDPTYYLNQPASWSEDPGAFEAQRLALAHIIDGL